MPDTSSVFYRIGQSVTSAVETKFSELAAQQVNINSIGDISDVETSAAGHVPSDGQALVWSASHGHWMPGDVTPDYTSVSDINNDGATSLNIGGSLAVGGNLTVSGTTTTVNTANLDVKDQYIKLNKGGYGYFDGSLAGNSSAGLEIEVGPDAAGGVEGPKVQFLYNAGDTASASPLQDRGYFETVYLDPGAVGAAPVPQNLQVKGLKVQNDAAGQGFDNLGNYEDFIAGLNA